MMAVARAHSSTAARTAMAAGAPPSGTSKRDREEQAHRRGLRIQRRPASKTRGADAAVAWKGGRRRDDDAVCNPEDRNGEWHECSRRVRRKSTACRSSPSADAVSNPEDKDEGAATTSPSATAQRRPCTSSISASSTPILCFPEDLRRKAMEEVEELKSRWGGAQR